MQDKLAEYRRVRDAAEAVAIAQDLAEVLDEGRRTGELTAEVVSSVLHILSEIWTLAGSSDPGKLRRRAKVLRDQLVMANQGLVRQQAQKTLGQKAGPDLDEAIQEGMMGLMHAIEVFDPERGPWPACAVLWIRYYVQTCMHRQKDFPRQRHQRMPPEVVRQANKIRALHGREPQPDELVSKGEPVTETQWRNWNTRMPICSADVLRRSESGEEPEETLADPTTDPATALESQGIQERLDILLTEMSPRNQEILRQVYTEGRSFRDVANEFGLAASNVHKIKRHLTDRLRKALGS